MSIEPSPAELRSLFFRLEPPQLMQADGYPWAHEVRVALPVSYEDSECAYPVLWITDNNLEAALSILGRAELILVSVGDDGLSVAEHGRRRVYDLNPSRDIYPGGARGEYLRREMSALLPGRMRSLVGGGANRFLDFLVDDVRPVLASQYRMDGSNHGLIGFSAGGTFVCYALFARPGAFTKYIAGSPGLHAHGSAIFNLENRYAAKNDDLAAHLFLAAGEAELCEYRIAAWGCVSSMARMAEILTLRRYPSLRLDTRVFPGETHATMLHPLLSWGVRAVWGDSIFSDPFAEPAE